MAQLIQEQKRLSNRVAMLETQEHTSVRDPAIALSLTIGLISALPALRGFWPGSGQAHPLTNDWDLLNMAGKNIPFKATSGGGTNTPFWRSDDTLGYPLVSIDGTNDFFSIADATTWDITGDKGTSTASAGLTMGAWVRFTNTASTQEIVLSKRANTAGRSYMIDRTSTGEARFMVSGTGTDFISISSAVVVTEDVWHFIVGRFIPSTEASVFLDGVEAIKTTSIPASIFVSTSDVYLGARDDGASPGAVKMNGDIAMVFLCAAQVYDVAIDRLYNISRHIFGV